MVFKLYGEFIMLHKACYCDRQITRTSYCEDCQSWDVLMETQYRLYSHREHLSWSWNRSQPHNVVCSWRNFSYVFVDMQHLFIVLQTILLCYNRHLKYWYVFCCIFINSTWHRFSWQRNTQTFLVHQGL